MIYSTIPEANIVQNHKVDQKLTCVGCGETFNRGCLLIEHIEFGHCENISAAQFQGHIVHKHLIKLYLEDDVARRRFQEKIGKFEAAQDQDEDGGVEILLTHLDTDVDQSVDAPAIAPEVEEMSPEATKAALHSQPYPPLPSTMSQDATATLASGMSRMSVTGDSQSAAGGSTLDAASATSSRRIAKAWNSNNSTASKLFPNAKPTPAPMPVATSVGALDTYEEKKFGHNLMRTRFWDPTSQDWNPEHFRNSVTDQYSCPFDCEQKFTIPSDLNGHILRDHRITKMRCPSCLNHFQSCTALVAHCESRGAKCQINKAEDFNTFLDRLTGGFLSVQELTRPEFVHNPAVTYTDAETGRVETYKPPTATYLQYEASAPPDFRPIGRQAAYQIGGQHMPGSAYRGY
ncbi:hypothetical protein P154DRAFT_518334 [Amniculicola lignicola CBS 123094]|uniref:C2H2-type domain-containing protein n=1 Tax=Amniculicola lignicola CBS 123094 TaxID=1392246 RepID=A0A6A5X2J2_9PLEO|nr:hypothetical protein P154DRAFT_518334 [Amniculicola lignicola CBS 123094]